MKKKNNIIGIASDHGGFELKKEIVSFLGEKKINFIDYGPENDSSVDYPDYGVKIAEAVLKGEINRGILVCGTGIGMSIVVNRFPGIRGALCNDLFSAKMSREHNDANILIMGGRLIGKGLAREIVETWLNTDFLGDRHQRRLDKIRALEGIRESGTGGENVKNS